MFCEDRFVIIISISCHIIVCFVDCGVIADYCSYAVIRFTD